jgi:hypothetical protein
MGEGAESAKRRLTIASARRYPLVTHWITDKLPCSSAARLDSETLTTVASNWARRDPRIATQTILHTRGSSRSRSSVCSGKGFQDLLCGTDACQSRKNSFESKAMFFGILAGAGVFYHDEPEA